MKTHFNSPRFLAVRSRLGFTLTELMVTMAIFSIALGGILAGHLYGLRMFELINFKLGASNDTRRALLQLVGEIRESHSVRIGEGGLSSFTQLPLNSVQKGNSLLIIPENTNRWIRYFYDEKAQMLLRTEDGIKSGVIVRHILAKNGIFTAEDFSGMPRTNYTGNALIHLDMNISKSEPASGTIGSQHHNFYQLRTKIAPRKLE